MNRQRLPAGNTETVVSLLRKEISVEQEAVWYYDVNDVIGAGL